MAKIPSSVVVPTQPVVESRNIDPELPPNRYKQAYKEDPTLGGGGELEPIPFKDLFRFADRLDFVLMAFGTFCAIGSGIAIPFFAYPYGEMTEAFAPNASKDIIVDQVRKAYISFLVNSVIVFLMSWVMFSTWMITSERQSIKCRQTYFRALMRQEVGWYDNNHIQELASNVFSETSQLQNAIGEKVSKLFMTISMGLAGFIIAYARGWRMALVVTCVIPFLLLAGFMNNHYIKKAAQYVSRINSKAQGLAEQVLYSIKTIKILNGENYQSAKYNRKIDKSTTKAIAYGFIRGAMTSLFFFCIVTTYTIGFWYGSVLVSGREINTNSGNIYSVGDVIIIFFTVYMSGLNLGQIPESLKNFMVGRKAAAKIYSVLDREPLLVTGLDLIEEPIREINLKNISFEYDLPLFNNLNIKISKGKTAFVGESGSGKSTIVALLMRFYDPINGDILLETNSRSLPLTTINLKHWRNKIGYVGQEPVLLGNTIREAVCADTERTEQEVISALKQAEAWNFVKGIGLDAEYGALSGGQKQRIAIARAIIKKPQILILDEATSALDRRNEKEIQDTLDKLNVPFMVVIAHKIQTIKSSNDIIVLEKGEILERGTYDSLMHRRGKFYNLAKNQTKVNEQEEALRSDKTTHGGKIILPSLTKRSLKVQEELIVPTTELKNGFLDDENECVSENEDEEIDAGPQIGSREHIVEPHLVKISTNPLKKSDEFTRSGELFLSNKMAQKQFNQNRQASKISEHAKGDQKYGDGKLSSSRMRNSAIANLPDASHDQKKMIAGVSQELNEEEEKQKIEKEFNLQLFWRLLNYNKQYFWLIVIGLVCAGFTGAVFPLLAAFLSKLIVLLSSMRYCTPAQIPGYQEEAKHWTSILFVITGLSLLTQFSKTTSFIYIAQRLSCSLKKDIYRKLLLLPYSYHENKGEKQTAAILSGDCHAVNGLTSQLLSDILENSTTLIVGLIIAFVSCWQITLVALAVIPLLLLAGKAQMNYNVGFSTETDGAYKKSHEIILTSILNYRTILAFNMEDAMISRYDELLKEPLQIAIKKGNIAGLLYGVSQMMISCILALIFFIGSIFIRDYQMNVLDIFTAIYAIMFAAIQAGGNLQFVPNIVQLKVAAVNIFKVLDIKDEEQMNVKAETPKVEGKIEFNHIAFKYPTRDVPVFTDLTFNINKGEKVALVGSSGCGKSTLLQLLLKMYDLEAGSIRVDGRDINDYELHHLRDQFGVVSQEPVLFNRTVASNIRYNKEGITDSELIEAATMSNSIGFIRNGRFGVEEKQADLDQRSESALNDADTLETGFNKRVGIKGSFLSGGQKQRVAIARAIVRKPKILLLDEATSALDTENQSAVQSALDSIKGLTTIIVAHRLSTIRQCDKIFVFEGGKIVEEGNYNDLMFKKGAFYRLANGLNQV